MYLEHLALTNFRSYARLEANLQARINVLQGENAQGKTNLLEAIYYLATTRSPLTSSDKQLIAWAARDEVIPFARLAGTFSRAGEEHSLEMTLVLERQPGGESEQASFRRQIRFDGTPRRALDVVGKLNVVLFLPEDIALVNGAPSERRHYLDVTLCQVDPLYCRALSSYNHVITQRNALLHQIREHQARSAELAYWDESLARLGTQVLTQRLEATRALAAYVADLHPALTGGQEHLQLSYQSSIGQHLAQAGDNLAPCAGATGVDTEGKETWQCEEMFRRALEIVRREEIARGVTTIGPHRDDVRLLVNAMDVTTYGSRGQQRTVALALKLAEMALMKAKTGEMPLLLLDDVISELDQRRSQFLLQTVSGAQQVLITATDLHCYASTFLDEAILWQVADGQVVRIR
jgi:DNA replication and repair protein RecF